MLATATHAAMFADADQIGAAVALIVAGLLGLAYVALIVTAFLGSLFSSQSAGMKLVWALFIICAPFLGALCWFVIGRGHAVRAAR